MKKRKKRQLH